MGAVRLPAARDLPHASRPLLAATNNPGKLLEYKALLTGLGCTVISPRQLGLHDEVAEEGSTFAENAALKAITYARRAHMLTLADDSGLEVDAMNGAPGIYSARYAGTGASDSDRIALLLTNLQGVPPEHRTARFRCVIAVAGLEGHLLLSEGTCVGSIASAPKGRFGFGYDPIFLIKDLHKTMGQIPPRLKQQISHRARAAASARLTLLRFIQDQSH